MKLEEKFRSRQFRLQGLSLKQIAANLHVSKGSVSAWVRDIELPQEYFANIEGRFKMAREKSRNTRLLNITKSQTELNQRCREEILPLSKRDLWIAGLMIYAGEGNKTSRISS